MTTITDEIPWLAAAERVYGPLADAFGLRPVRDAFETWFGLAAAQLGEVVANAQVASVVAAASFDGISRVTQRLDRLRRDGQPEGQTLSSPTHKGARLPWGGPAGVGMSIALQTHGLSKRFGGFSAASASAISISRWRP